MPIGGGISLGRMALISSGGIGQGLTDVMLATFVLDALRQFGASKFLAFIAIAIGSVASIIFAPLAGAFGGRSGAYQFILRPLVYRTAYITLWFGTIDIHFILALVAPVLHGPAVKMRKVTTIICFTIAASAALAIGIVSGNHSVTSDGPREENRTIMVVVIVLAAVYRASTQAAPIVPMCIDAASHKVKGNEQASDARISIGLSFFYLNYKLGFLVANIVLSTLPKRDVDRLLPSFVGAALVFFMTIGVTALSMPSGQLGAAEAAKDGEALKQAPTPTPPARPAMIVAADDIWLTVIRGSPRLKAVFVETICYGVAFGALSSIVAPFYNEVVFKAPPGASKGSACCKRTEPRTGWYLALKWLLKRLTFLPSFCRISSQYPIHYLPYPVAWMAYSGLISFAVEMVHDAVIGSLAFAAIAVDFGMTFFWVAELLIGAGLFVALYFITNKNAALVVFGMLVLASAAHGFFTLVACGALVSEPRLRPTAFGVRASCLHLGWLAGSVIAAFISDGARGFRPVMLMGALATQGASAAAVMVGSVERPRFSGVAVNANPLIKWVFRKEAAFNDREADVLECDSGGSAERRMGRK